MNNFKNKKVKFPLPCFWCEDKISIHLCNLAVPLKMAQ